MADSHNNCAPYPAEVKEVLEKGPKGPDGKPLTKLIDYFSSKDPHYVVEIRPAKRSQGKEIGLKLWMRTWKTYKLMILI